MPNLSLVPLALIQTVLLLALAPLMTGISRQMRARIHSRRGPGVLQDYRDIIKLLKRQDVAPGASGWVFRLTPYLILGVTLILGMAVPALTRHSPVPALADMITFAYLFALIRFFFALTGIDSGSSFAGIGAGRELTLGILVEPAMVLSLLVVALSEGTTNLGSIGAAIHGNYLNTPVAITLAALAFAFTAFIEMGKLPFDMAEAEQELQEGPLTEYSGSALATLQLGLAMKKVVTAQFLLGVFLPFGCAAVLTPSSLVIALIALLLKLVVVFVLAALVENSMARGRFLLVSVVTWMGLGLAALAFVMYLTGL